MPEIPQRSQLFRSQIEIEIGWPRMLLAFVLVIVIGLTATQLLIASYERVLAGRSADLDREIQDLSGVIPSEDLARLVKLDRQIRNLRILLGSHVYLSRLLDELERLTLPQVRYIIVRIDRDKSTVSIRGNAPSMDAVGMQAAAFSRSPFISSVLVRGANISGAGGILFGFDVVFAPSLIQPPLQ